MEGDQEGSVCSSEDLDSWFDTEEGPRSPRHAEQKKSEEWVESKDMVNTQSFDTSKKCNNGVDEPDRSVPAFDVMEALWEEGSSSLVKGSENDVVETLNQPVIIVSDVKKAVHSEQVISTLEVVPPLGETNGHVENLDEWNNDVNLRNLRRRSSTESRLRLSRSVSEGGYRSINKGNDDGVMDYLGKVTTDAEARLAARRQARAEAREIRMRELEVQRKEAEENADRHYDLYTDSVGPRPSLRGSATATRTVHHSGSASYQSSRRSSEDSTEEGINVRDIRHELKETEEKFRKAMVQNAQLDNEKAALTYEVELLKDKLGDEEEKCHQLQRLYKDKSREFDILTRTSTGLKEEIVFYKYQLEERDSLIAENGLVIMTLEGEEEDGKPPKRALISQESSEILAERGKGSVDSRLKRFAEENNDLMDQIRRLKLDLEEERCRGFKTDHITGNSTHMNGPEDILEQQREASKLLSDYKFRAQKAEQEVATLQASVTRLESQVIRYKSASESAEKQEDELKSEKRKLQRELRDVQTRLEEVETTNVHLERRLDKLKNAKSALLKEL